MRKIKFIFVFLLLIVLCTAIKAQNYKKNKYNPEVIDNINDYSKEINKNKNAKLMPLLSAVPHLKTNFVYATDINFTHTVLYKNPRPYAVLPMVQALQKAAEILEKKGFGIMLFDAYRPYSVTQKMWEAVPDARYAADPKYGSGHNRGISVDITLYKLSTGELLKMPTNFDNFTDTAHSDFMQLPEEMLANRKLLKTIMESCGLKQLSTEWWHFSVPDPGNEYKIINLSFDTLNNFIKGN